MRGGQFPHPHQTRLPAAACLRACLSAGCARSCARACCTCASLPSAAPTAPPTAVTPHLHPLTPPAVRMNLSSSRWRVQQQTHSTRWTWAWAWGGGAAGAAAVACHRRPCEQPGLAMPIIHLRCAAPAWLRRWTERRKSAEGRGKWRRAAGDRQRQSHQLLWRRQVSVFRQSCDRSFKFRPHAAPFPSCATAGSHRAGPRGQPARGTGHSAPALAHSRQPHRQQQERWSSSGATAGGAGCSGDGALGGSAPREPGGGYGACGGRTAPNGGGGGRGGRHPRLLWERVLLGQVRVKWAEVLMQCEGGACNRSPSPRRHHHHRRLPPPCPLSLRRQFDFVQAEKAMGRNASTITAVAGYAGGASPAQKVCYYRSPPGTGGWTGGGGLPR